MEYHSTYGEFFYSFEAAVEHALEAGLVDTKDDLTYLSIEILYDGEDGTEDFWFEGAHEVYRVDSFENIMELGELQDIGSGVILICDDNDGEPELSGIAVRYYDGGDYE